MCGASYSWYEYSAQTGVCCLDLGKAILNNVLPNVDYEHLEKDAKLAMKERSHEGDQSAA